MPLLSFPLCGNELFRPLDSSLRWNDDGGRDGFFCQPDNPFAILGKCPTPASFVIYGQEVLYAVRGQEARSRPAQAGIQEGGAGVLDGLRFLPTVRNNASVVIPA